MRPYFCQCKDASSLGRQNEFLNGRQFNDAKFHVTYVVYIIVIYVCVYIYIYYQRKTCLGHSFTYLISRLYDYGSEMEGTGM